MVMTPNYPTQFQNKKRRAEECGNSFLVPNYIILLSEVHYASETSFYKDEDLKEAILENIFLV